MPTQEELQKLLMIGFAVLFLGAARVQWPWLVAENARVVGVLAHVVLAMNVLFRTMHICPRLI